MTLAVLKVVSLLVLEWFSHDMLLLRRMNTSQHARRTLALYRVATLVAPVTRSRYVIICSLTM